MWGWDEGPLLLAVGFVNVKWGSGPATPCNRLAEARVAAKEVAKNFFGVWNFGSEGSFGLIRVRTVVSARFSRKTFFRAKYF